MVIYAATSRFNFNICSCVRPNWGGEKLTGGRGSGVVCYNTGKSPNTQKKNSRKRCVNRTNALKMIKLHSHRQRLFLLLRELALCSVQPQETCTLSERWPVISDVSSSVRFDDHQKVTCDQARDAWIGINHRTERDKGTALLLYYTLWYQVGRESFYCTNVCSEVYFWTAAKRMNE